MPDISYLLCLRYHTLCIMTGKKADHKTLASTIPKPAAGILKYLQLLIESFTYFPKNVPSKHR